MDRPVARCCGRDCALAGTVAIDRRNDNGLLSQSVVGNGADGQSILTTIATSVVTLTSMVLTVTLVAAQLAMGQFSPRIVRVLLDDRGDQFAIAIFGATFTFAVFSLRAIDTGPGGKAVPGVTVLTALALAAASAFALFVFVHHAGQQCGSARWSTSSATSCAASSTAASHRLRACTKMRRYWCHGTPATSSAATATPWSPKRAEQIARSS